MPSDLQVQVQSTTPDVELTIAGYVGSAYSPQVEVEDIDGGHNVSITHKGPDGIVTDSFDVMDGVSPTVDITSTTQRHTITITDAQGPHVYEVDTYADEELARATAENGRASAESARVSAESARAIAETGRSTAERARDEAESARSAAETARAENEGTRVTNETARANAEIARDAAEQAREQAETSREAAWATLSQQATSATQAANNAAQTASQAASAANSAAQSASQAESTMTANETARASAEQGRASAESARVTAETARAETWAELVDDVEDATEAAESATQDATDAAALATRAAANLWNAGNVLRGTLAESAVLTADDAFAAPPESVEVYGKSEQDGTPTPDAPVPILSVDDLTLVFAGKNLANNDKANAGYLTSAGNVISLANWYHTDLIPVIAGANYYLSGLTANTQQAYFLWRAEDESVISSHTYNAMKTTPSRVAPANAKYAQISYKADDTALQFELGSTATAYVPYTGQSVQVLDQPLRSLPDGTEDSLTLSYIGPSETEGWGVYSRELTRNVAESEVDDTENWKGPYNYTSGAGYYTSTKYPNRGRSKLCNYAIGANGGAAGANTCYFGGAHELNLVGVAESAPTLADWKALLAATPLVVQYPLATPTTETLDPIELPVLPNPLTAWADGGSAQPTLSMTYEQDINIVIGELRSAIADMATS